MKEPTMNANEDLQQQITEAIQASECIVNCLHEGDFEGAKKFDLQRADFIRALSKCRNLEDMPVNFTTQLKLLSELNESILSISHELRDNVLTEIRVGQTNRSRHEQYIRNQNL